MAKAYIAVKNGNVAGTTSGTPVAGAFSADFQRYEVHHSQPSEEITNWTTGTYQWNRGTGVEASDITAFGFAFKGTATSNPGFGSMAASGGDTGATATITMDGSCTITGTYVVYDLLYHESRIEAAAKVTIRMKTGAADPAVAWLLA